MKKNRNYRRFRIYRELCHQKFSSGRNLRPDSLQLPLIIAENTSISKIFLDMKSHFPGINASGIIALPAFMFFKSADDFKVRYKISCRNVAGAIEGELL